MRKCLLFVALVLVLVAHSMAHGQSQQFTGLITQANPTATALVTIYTVPHLTSVTVNTIWVANRDSSTHSFRMSVARQGAADNVMQYIFYNVPLPANSTLIQNVDLVLNDSDQVRVYVDAQDVSFSLFGTIYGTIPTPTPTPTPT